MSKHIHGKHSATRGNKNQDEQKPVKAKAEKKQKPKSDVSNKPCESCRGL